MQIRKLLMPLAAGFCALSAWAQGTINFANYDPAAGINAPVFDADGVTKLSGAGYLAQLYAGPDASSLAPVGAAVPFRTASGAGYWDPAPNAERAIPSVAPGGAAVVEVRVWEAAKGATFDQAVAHGSKTGASDPLSLTTGGAGSPPSLPANLVGLKSFQLQLPQTQIAPQIVMQPHNRVVREGQTAQLMVVAKGGSDLVYQWQKQAADNSWQNVAGQTSATFNLPNAQKSDSGEYRVEVSFTNGGSVASNPAALRVIAPPGFAKGHGKGPRKNPDGSFQSDIDLDPDVTYDIEVSTDLVNWTVLATISNASGSFPLVDKEMNQHHHRFFRVVAVDN